MNFKTLARVLNEIDICTCQGPRIKFSFIILDVETISTPNSHAIMVLVPRVIFNFQAFYSRIQFWIPYGKGITTIDNIYGILIDCNSFNHRIHAHYRPYIQLLNWSN